MEFNYFGIIAIDFMHFGFFLCVKFYVESDIKGNFNALTAALRILPNNLFNLEKISLH